MLGLLERPYPLHSRSRVALRTRTIEKTGLVDWRRLAQGFIAEESERALPELAAAVDAAFPHAELLQKRVRGVKQPPKIRS
jgi:hypothetical protein